MGSGAWLAEELTHDDEAVMDGAPASRAALEGFMVDVSGSSSWAKSSSA